MSMSVSLCLLSLLISFHFQHQTSGEARSKGITVGNRTKRAGSIRALFSTAVWVGYYPARAFYLFKKHGGFSQALDDFYSLRPSMVTKTKGAIKGQLGGREVELDYATGHPTLSVKKEVKTQPATSMIIMQKIQYFD